jgi:excisionase family DNA binding protein
MGGMTVTIPSLTLSVADAAFELSCSQDHVRTLIREGELPASRIGARIVIRREDLEELLLRNRL